MKQRDMTPRQPPAMPGTAPGSWPVPEAQPQPPLQPLEPLPAVQVTVPVPPAGDPGAQAEPPRSLPLPQGGAMRRMALDLLYQNSAAQTAQGARDHIDVPPPPLPRRPLRERRLGRLLLADDGDDGLEAEESGHLPAMDGNGRARQGAESGGLLMADDNGSDGLETDIEDWLVAAPPPMPAPGGGPAAMPADSGKSGSGGARMMRSGIGGLLPDASPEGIDGGAPQSPAIVDHTFIHPLRPPRMARPGSLPALRPKSRAECERRCGSDGFCDPSDPLGCGGIHCGRR